MAAARLVPAGQDPYRLLEGVAAFGIGGAGAGIGIAALAEESGKLVPLLVLAVLAPGRVRRFAVTDWLLGGFACGLAFTLVEQSARLISLGPWGVPAVAGGPDQSGLPGWSPVSGDWVSSPAVTPGHHVHTALVAVAIGLAVVCVRHSRGAAWRAAGAALPVLAWWIAVSDHAAFNASINLLVDQDRWPLHSSIPPAIGLTWQVLGHGAGRGAVLLLALVVALLVDACRIAAGDGGVPLLPGVPWSGASWAVHADARMRAAASTVATRSTALLTPVLRGLVVLAGAALLLAAYTARDLAVVVAAHARSPGEPIRFGLARGRAAMLVTRDAREDAYAAALPYRPSLLVPRLCALSGIVLLLLLAVPGALVLAHQIGPAVTTDGGWLAGWLDRIGTWWNSLSPATKLLLGFALAALLMLIPGVGFGAALFLSGIVTYLLDHANDLADLTRDPRGTTRRYLTTTSPQQMALDAILTILTFLPGNALGAATGRVLDRSLAALLARRGLLTGSALRDLATTVPNGTEEALHLGSVGPATAKSIVRRFYPGLEKVNAREWAQRTSGYTENCTSCVVATEYRLRGFGYRSASMPSAADISSVARALGGQWQKLSSYDDVVRAVRARGPGTHGVVFIHPGRGRIGHVFNVVFDDHGVVFLDGQTGTLAGLRSFHDIRLLIVP